MLDMGFIRDIRKVLAVLPPRAPEPAVLGHLLRRDPVACQRLPPRSGHRSRCTPRNSAAPLVTQVVHPVDRERKRELLSRTSSGPASSTRRSSSRAPSTGPIASPSSSSATASRAVAIHGNKSQGQRVRALADFKAGRTPILVATEIAARGLDIDGLPHVVNFELPMVPQDYVHRIGRTGRAGSPGHAVSLVCVDEQKLLREIEAGARARRADPGRRWLRAGPLDPTRADPARRSRSHATRAPRQPWRPVGGRWRWRRVRRTASVVGAGTRGARSPGPPPAGTARPWAGPWPPGPTSGPGPRQWRADRDGSVRIQLRRWRPSRPATRRAATRRPASRRPATRRPAARPAATRWRSARERTPGPGPGLRPRSGPGPRRTRTGRTGPGRTRVERPRFRPAGPRRRTAAGAVARTICPDRSAALTPDPRVRPRRSTPTVAR